MSPHHLQPPSSVIYAQRRSTAYEFTACQGGNVREHIKVRAAMRPIGCMWCTDKPFENACFDEMLIAAYLPSIAFIDAKNTAWEGNAQPPSNDEPGASWPQCLPMAIRPTWRVPASATAHQQQQIALLACSALHKHKSSDCEACVCSVWHARSLSRAMTPQYYSMYHKATMCPAYQHLNIGTHTGLVGWL